MRFQVQFHCDDCKIFNDRLEQEEQAYQKETEFFNLTQAVEHLREHPDHHVEAYIDDDRKLIEVAGIS